MRVDRYPKVLQYNGFGTQSLLEDEVVIQSKIDGSQFSAQKTKEGFIYRSRGHQINIDNCENLFKPTIAHFESIKNSITFPVGWTIRGEAMCGKQHNIINYAKAPRGNFVLFDIQCKNKNYIQDRRILEYYAEKLCVDIVPEIYRGRITHDELMILKKELLEQEEFLGGSKREGIVIKNYSKLIEINGEVRPIFCKIVREEFKEIQRYKNKTAKNKLEDYFKTFRSEARWQKAVQHLRDSGKLIGDPKDIGLLMGEVNKDIIEEEKENIKDTLFKMLWKKIAKEATAGLPEWYKEKITIGEANK